MLLCTFLSYMAASGWESLAHWKILHASSRSRMSWRRWGEFGDLLRLAYFYHHVIHHQRTFVNSYFVQFDSHLQQQKLDRLLKSGIRSRLKLNGYGTRITGFLELFTFAAVPMLINSALFAMLAPRGMAFGVMIALLPLLLSRYVHPFLHVEANELLARHQGLSHMFFKSRFFRYLQKYHFLHHQNVMANFNLLLGADFLFRVYKDAHPGPQARRETRDRLRTPV